MQSLQVAGKAAALPTLTTRLLVALAAFSLLAGCTRNHDSASARLSAYSDNKTAGAAAKRYLAYEHTIYLDTDEAKIASVFEAAQAACRQAAEDHCVVLESRLNTGHNASAALKLRAKPTGIQKLIATLSKEASLTSQSTSAEDLEAPITDAARKLAMLTDYRERLEALRESAKSDVEALIKVNRELAQAQSELEAAAGHQARLAQRVETQLLHVHIEALQNRSFWQPIRAALKDFGANFSHGISAAITGVAYLVPWLALLALAGWLLRKLWRRRARLKT